jgi:hypothetical protein
VSRVDTANNKTHNPTPIRRLLMIGDPIRWLIVCQLFRGLHEGRLRIEFNIPSTKGVVALETRRENEQ